MESSSNPPRMKYHSYEDSLKKYRELQAEKDKADRIKNNINEGLGHAVGYTRVSTTMQAEDGNSMESQKKNIEIYCKLKNLILDDVFEEPAKSGADRKRVKLIELIQSLKSGMKVICNSVDRLCRDTCYLLQTKEKIHEKGCSLYFIDRSLDTNDTSTELLMTIMAAVASENRKAQNRNISSVMQDMSRKGTLRTRPKYGWKITNTNNVKELVINDEEQEVINLIRCMINDDKNISLSDIARNLTKAGIKIRNCQRIYPTTIKNIIEHNELRN